MSGPTALELRRRADKRRRWLTTALVITVLLALGAVIFPRLAEVRSPYASQSAPAQGSSQRRPLGHPPRTEHGVGTFSVSAEQVTSDVPVSYDPCRKIPWAIHDELAPPGTDRIVEAAVRQISLATGLVFARRDAGPAADYHSVSARYGRSPIIIDWSTPQEVRSLVGATTGVGGSAFLPDAQGQRHYVTGAIALDTPQLERILARPRGAAIVRAVVMHELGHVVGLDHVDDRGELMYGDGIPRVTLGPGDREGLALLGSGSCAM